MYLCRSGEEATVDAGVAGLVQRIDGQAAVEYLDLLAAVEAKSVLFPNDSIG